MSRVGCMNMNLETITQAKEIAKDIRTQFCTQRLILRNSYEASKMRVIQKIEMVPKMVPKTGFTKEIRCLRKL